MSKNTNSYMPRLRNFLQQVALNNNREWFAAHKELYTELRDLWLDDVQRLINAMSSFEPRLEGATARSCAYRFYRDTRFSPDKSPYKTFFSAAFSPYGKNSSQHAGYYLQTGIDSDSGLWGGIYCPSSDLLKKLRRAIVDNIEEFDEIVHDPQLQKLYPGWTGEMLKTAPKGWDKDHPQIELLRLKDYGKFHPCAPGFFDRADWPERSAELFSVLKPLIDFLNYSIDEEIL